MFFKKFMGKPLPPVMGGRKPSSPSPAPTTNTSPSNGGGSSGKNRNGIIGYFFIPTVLATLWLVTIGISLNNSIEIGIFIVVFILTAINILVGKGASKWISLGLAVVMGCIIWGNYNYINSSTPPTEQSAGQEQVASPSPPPEVWDSTQFSDRGGILLNKPSQEVNVPENSELCVSELINPLTNGNLQQKIFVGEEFFSSRMSKCWDITKGKYTIRIGDTDSAEIKQYKDYNGRFPVIRPK